MPESGGPANQSGILYQNSIAAIHMGRLCDSQQRPPDEMIVGVAVETIDSVDDIVATYADGHRDYVQAKERLSRNSEAWKKLWHDFSNQFLADDFKIGSDKLVLWVGSLRDRDDLEELSSRAHTYQDFDAWERQLTQDQRKLIDNKILPLLTPNLAQDHDKVLSFFRHVQIENKTRRDIERDFIYIWMPESNISPLHMFTIMRDQVGGKARLRGDFEKEALIETLRRIVGDFELKKSPSIDVLRQEIRGCNALLRGRKNTFGNTEIHLHREVVNKIVEWASNSVASENFAVLLDQAGYGKTVVMQDVLMDIEERGIDVLAIKADQQLADMKEISDIQKKLNLSGTPERIIQRLAEKGRVVVLVDQVDALSYSLAGDQETLNNLLDFIARLKRISNVKVLMSCRIFDYRSDPRLRNMIHSNEFSIPELTKDEISGVLWEQGLDIGGLSPATRELLKIPLHLNLFSLILSSDDVNSDQLTNLNGLQMLYDAILNYVALQNDPNAPSKSLRMDVLRQMILYMEQQQITTVPQSYFLNQQFEDLEPAIDWLARKGILISGSQNWTFIHQTFQDYLYAKNFVDHNRDLFSMIMGSTQGLEKRSQLIQIITYMRGKGNINYLNVLEQLLFSKELRYHLYDLLLSWFGSISEPTDGEKLIAKQLLLIPGGIKKFLQRCSGNSDWFHFLKNHFIPLWLKEETYVDDHLVYYLSSLINDESVQEEIIDLIKPYVGKSQKWSLRLMRILTQNQNWKSSETVGLFEDLFYKLPVSNQENYFVLRMIAENHPKSVVRLLRFLLEVVYRRYLENHDSENRKDNYFSSLNREWQFFESNHLLDVFEVVSQREPKYFIEKMMSWLQEIMGYISLPETLSEDYYYSDPLSGYWFSEGRSFEKTFHSSFCQALSLIAKTNKKYFSDVVKTLQAFDFQTPQILLAMTFIQVPEDTALMAYEIIIEEQRWLDFGSGQYISRNLIAAIFPYLNEKHQISIERTILNYRPINKSMGLHSLNNSGIEQLVLLESIPFELLTGSGKSRLRELRHKFPNTDVSNEPPMVKGGFVQSPISLEQARKMTDEQWLSAINKYHHSVEHKDFLKGGARQLSSILEKLIKDDYSVYVSLIGKFDKGIDDAYVKAAINGLAESSCPDAFFFECVRKFSQHTNGNIKRTIAWGINKRVKSQVPSDLIALLWEYVHQDVGEDEWWWKKGENHGGVYSSYLNSDRGAAFSILMRIYDKQKTSESLSRKWELIEYASEDPSTALRLGAIHELVFMISYDGLRAIRLFKKLIKSHEILLETDHVYNFIYYSLDNRFLKVCPYIKRMLNHKNQKIIERGAQLACLSDLGRKQFKSKTDVLLARLLAWNVMRKSISGKRGAARVYGRNLTGNLQELCTRRLKRLIKVEDKEVQEIIGNAFYYVNPEDFYKLRGFFEFFAMHSKVPNFKFVEYVFENGMSDPYWSLSLIELIMSNRYMINGTPFMEGFEEIIRLVIRIYSGPKSNDQIRKKAMDCFDQLMRKNPAFCQRILSEYEA